MEELKKQEIKNIRSRISLLNKRNQRRIIIKSKDNVEEIDKIEAHMVERLQYIKQLNYPNHWP